MAEPQTKTPSARKPSGRGGQPTGPAAPPPKFRELIRNDLNIDFVGKRRFFALLSTILNVAAVALFFVVGLNYGVDFRGGTDMRVRFAEPTSAAALRGELAPLDLRELTVQDFGVQGREFLLRFDVSEGEEMSSVADTIATQLRETHSQEGSFEILSVESVGPKVGSQLRQQGLLAVIVATICMGIYIALNFEWSFGVGAVVALIHDVLITIGALVLTQLTFDLTTLAALLTVVGFSVNDTIIISDRIRENLRRNPKADLASVINRSINETLSRTLLTTGTVLLVLIGLLAFGGTGLRPFSFTLFVGFLTGAYSTIYIAAPIVLLWADRSKLAA
jgi:preprotein translocase subunit SecF